MCKASPVCTSARSHQENPNVIVGSEVIQYLLAPGKCSISIDSYECEALSSQVTLNEIKGSCPGRKDDAVYMSDRRLE